MTCPQPPFRLDPRVADHERILKALTRAVQEAVERHRLAGNPVATWRDGRVVWIPAEDLPPLEPKPQDD